MYSKTTMHVSVRAMERIFSLGERFIAPFNSAIATLNGTINLSPHENILKIALLKISYLYAVLVASGRNREVN